MALAVVGLVDALEERRADGTALAGSLDHEQTVVDLTGLGNELVEVVDAPQTVEVLGLGFQRRLTPPTKHPYRQRVLR